MGFSKLTTITSKRQCFKEKGLNYNENFSTTKRISEDRKSDRFVFNNKYEKYISERKTFKSFIAEEKEKLWIYQSLYFLIVARFMLPEKEVKIANIKTILKKLIIARGKLPKEIELKRKDKKETGCYSKCYR